MDIEELKGKSVFELSSGQKQKTAIASIYAMNPKFLILDEPSTNLDMKATFDLFLILKKLKKKGTTVVLIEHRLYYVKSLFDRFLLVKDGEIAQDLSREEVIHLEGEFCDENGLRTLELEEYIISDRKDSYHLNDESISGKSLRFCYPNVAKDGKKQNKYILNHLDFNMECGKAIGIIGLKGTVKCMEVSNIEIWCECFGKAKEDIKPADSYAISAIMKRLKEWEKTGKRGYTGKYGQQRLYIRK